MNTSSFLKVFSKVVDERYDHPGKKYLIVDARFSDFGSILPTAIISKDGHRWEVKVLDIEKAASLKAGGCGIRYTCNVAGKQIYLFLENYIRWFTEAKS